MEKNIKELSNTQIPLISIITVVRDGVKMLEKTILSVINQTYTNIEYIIIDGASTDGTLDIIKKYSNNIAYWISEPDGGIYYAMNKGIDLVTGDWINFMNCGDTFTASNVIENIFKNKYSKYDILYGDSTEITDKSAIIKYSHAKTIWLKNGPIYRHGASFIKTYVHKKEKFDISKISELGFALDYELIYRLFNQGKKFKYLPINILSYQKEGVSSNFLLAQKYIYLITHKKYNLIKFFTYLFQLYIKKLIYTNFGLFHNIF
jgi:glycosyltransferase involved in cell wall biosynthesis